MKPFKLAIFTLLFGITTVFNVHAGTTHPAQAVVEDTLEMVISALNQQEENQDIATIINHIILPRFDFTKMSQWALGNEWDKLDESRKDLFISHFQQSLVNTYATALTEFDNQSVDVLTARVGKQANIAAVPTRINLSNTRPLSISYMLMSDESGNEWKVVDVSISGVSIIKSYRATYASEIRRSGFDGLMQKMIEKNKLAAL
jgi:phospholipid transport system substrate-binding protein